MVFFDYIYYRVAKAYFKKHGRTGMGGIVAVAFTQSLTIIGLTFLLIDRPYETYRKQNLNTRAIVLFIAVFIIINYFSYYKRYNQLRFKWKDESEVAAFYKGILVFLAVVLPWIFLLVVLTYQSHEYKYFLR
jgi:uncharacterized membrane-anchored protein